MSKVASYAMSSFQIQTNDVDSTLPENDSLDTSKMDTGEQSVPLQSGNFNRTEYEMQ